ncbi:MAG TPA: nucleotidyltransferase family protein [Ilumatobacteraceae bacterium]|nr:nucleotidyltransferase family protein [Ilumatobacteraceae bacterium]
MGPRVAALLAAGGGSRFAGPDHKLLADFDGRPVWLHALAHVLDADFDHVVVVTGAVALDLPAHVIERHNHDWAAGQSGSLQLAVGAARELGAEAVTIGLADQPFVTAAAWRAVAEAPATCRVAIAVYDGVAGPHPVRLDASVWPLLPADGDTGARELLRAHPEWVCRIDCVGSGADIDTQEDLARWTQG